MYRLLNTLSILLTVSGLSALRLMAGEAGTLTEKSISIDGVTRQFRIYLSKLFDTNQPEPYPAVLVFHGKGQRDLVDMAAMTFFHLKAEKENFVSVFPDGSLTVDPFNPNPQTRGWNVGEPACDNLPVAGGCRPDFVADDVGFVDGLLDHLIQHYHVNPRRIYATGFSSGALMTYALGCLRSDKIAAFAPSNGYLYLDPQGILGGVCNPPKPIQLVDLTGTKDPTFKINDITKISSLGTPTEKCGQPPKVTHLKPKTSDPRTVDLLTYPTCDWRNTVLQYRVNEGGTPGRGGTFRNRSAFAPHSRYALRL